jgi:phosphoribosylformimino-5-aminoimidazole carboxamide ribotide isomerase
MRIVGVIDIRGGRAVHARRGDRARYEPIDVAVGEGVGGDVVALARVYVERLGVRELYVADLDAIEAGSGLVNRGSIGGVVALGAAVWLDAGVSSVAESRAVCELGVRNVVVGLETLTGLDALADVCAAVGGQRVVFSLDLRDGVPVVLPNALPVADVVTVAGLASRCGVGSIVLLDLARVGSERGVDLELLSRVRRAAPNVALFVGGGIRGQRDVDAVAMAGANGALTATALLNGAVKLQGISRGLTP